MAYQLTEDNIKHCTLGFLKSYYKNNSSRGFGHTEARLDMVSKEGIIADGYLKFNIKQEGEGTEWDDLMEEEQVDKKQKKGHSKKGDNKKKENKKTEDKKPKKEKAPPPKQNLTFLATFEATSQDTAEEIQYKVQNKLLLLDAFTIALMVAAGSYGYNYLNDQYTLNELGFVKFWGGFFSVLMSTLIGYVLLCRFANFPRYRYIFALAQFDRYHADEQWISYGVDVFANATNKYLQELKDQCTKKGVGLIMVNEQLQPSLIMTPAREPAGKKGRIRQFFDASTAMTKKGFSWLRLPNWIKNKFSKKLPDYSNAIPSFDTGDYLRYSKSYWKQGLLILFSVLVMGEIYWEELKNPNIVYIDHEVYEEKILAQTKDNRSEHRVTFIDLETGDRKKVIDPRVPNKIPTNAANTDSKIAKKKEQARQRAAKQKAKVSYEKGLIVNLDNNQLQTYSCKRLSMLKGEAYLIEVDVAKDYKEAVQKLEAYAKSGLKINAMNLSCFYKNKFDYVIYLDDIFTVKSQAEAAANAYHQLKTTKGVKTGQTKIRILRHS